MSHTEPASETIFVSDLLRQRHRQLADSLAGLFGSRLRLIPGTQDIWCRDYMPVELGQGRFVQFRYEPGYLRDAPRLRTPDGGRLLGLGGCRNSDLVIDGGNVVRSGRAAIVTDRIYRENPRLERPALRQRLAQDLEVDRLVVIPAEPGDVLGHADGVLRFVDERTLLVNDYRQIDSGYGERLHRLLRRHGFELVKCPYVPSTQIGRDGIPSAAGAYINFLQTDNVIVCPAFDLPEDEQAMALLERCFPTHQVLALRCGPLAAEGGVLNCVTWTMLGGEEFGQPCQAAVPSRPAMDFIVTDREGIEAGVRVRCAYAVISIHDPDRPPAKVRRQSGLRGVLHLAFHDAEPAASLVPNARVTLMRVEQARQIWQFVAEHQGVGAVVVQCEQGMSRSPAVAAALCKGMGGDERRFWGEYQPNQYVYRLVLDAGENTKTGGTLSCATGPACPWPLTAKGDKRTAVRAAPRDDHCPPGRGPKVQAWRSQCSDTCR